VIPRTYAHRFRCDIERVVPAASLSIRPYVAILTMKAFVGYEGDLAGFTHLNAIAQQDEEGRIP
jgi:hypothetical protein